MTINDFLSRLGGLRHRGNGWLAKCPAHPDKNPSLSIHEGGRGVLVKCWAGCAFTEICARLGIEPRDLFFDALDADPSRRREAAQDRERQRQRRERQREQQGTLIDALRAADTFIQSRRGIEISAWSHDRLNDELNALADAYRLVESEALSG